MQDHKRKTPKRTTKIRNLPSTTDRKQKAKNITLYRQAFCEIQTLFVLKEYGSQGITELVKHLKIHPYSVAEICNNLIELKLVKNAKSTAKKGTYILTEDGKKACKVVNDLNQHSDQHFGLTYFTMVKDILFISYRDTEF